MRSERKVVAYFHHRWAAATAAVIYSSLTLTSISHKSNAIMQSDLAYRMSPGQCNYGHVKPLYMHTKLKDHTLASTRMG